VTGLIASPDLAVLTLLTGILLVYWECNRPGTIVPGCAGTLLVLLSANSLLRMPLRPAALVLLTAGLALLLVEIAFSINNLLAALGVLAIVAGLRFLVQPFAFTHVHIATALFAGAGFGVATVWLGKIALRARRNKRSHASLHGTATAHTID
jgi:membrane-bound ClpP family serine protease